LPQAKLVTINVTANARNHVRLSVIN
jgi:hypothetical protein